MGNETVYLDNNSTTPLDPAVLATMLPYLESKFGNPSNTVHDYGVEAARAVELARSQVAALLGTDPKEVVFTSGATESNNLAILGAVRANRARGDHVITTAVEHKAVLNPCKQLEREGVRVTYLPVERTGAVHAEAVREAMNDRTVLVSVMAANNEVGTLQPVRDVGQACKERGVLFHTDAVQALGKMPIDVEDLGVDLLSVSAHKMYGPKGVGALYVRRRNPAVQLEPLVYGGGQEGGLRSGTLPVAQMVGLGVACELARQLLATEPPRLCALGGQLIRRIRGELSSVIEHGDPNNRLPGLLSVGFPAVDGDAFIHCLKGVAVSQGSSCSAGSFEPSHVLRAMGLSDELARATIRMGVGRFTTSEEVDRAAELIVEAVRRLDPAAH